MNIVKKIKAHPYYTGLAVIVIVGGIWYWRGRQNNTTVTQYMTETVARETIISSVNGTGQVSTLKSLDLKPQINGTTNQTTITKVSVTPGQIVRSGAVVAVLDDTNAAASLSQANASYISAKANYDKVVNGALQSDIDSANRSINSAQISLSNAQTNLANTIDQQNTAVANAYRNLLNGGLNPILDLGYTNSQGITDADAPVITGTFTATTTGSYFVTQQAGYFSATGIENVPLQAFDKRIPAALGNSGLYIQFPNNGIVATWEIDIPNVRALSYAANYSAYQTALLTQKTQVANAQNSVASAQINLENAEAALTKLQLPADASTVASAKSQLINAQSNLRTAQTNYNNTRIIAPFDGQIALVNSQKGDRVSGSTIIATLITEQKIAEVTLNEVDAAKVKVGDPVTLAFDAIPDLTLTGKVSQIDLVGTVTQGVVNYNVKIAFDAQDDRVRPDMSVSAAIITDKKADVIAVPNSAVKKSGGSSYVEVVDDSMVQSKNGSLITLKSDPKVQVVQTGISNDSMTEITAGLSGGETIISRTINNRTSQSTGNSSVRIPGLGGGGGGRF